LRLITFPVTAKFKNNNIMDLIHNGLLEYIKNFTELDVVHKEYIVKKNDMSIQEIAPREQEFNFTVLDETIFVHCGVIDLSWE